VKIFRQAEIYRRAQEHLQRELILTPPAIMTSSFASELFLKCLICMKTTMVSPEHDLNKLFSLVEAKTQSRITDLWNANVTTKKDVWETFAKVYKMTVPTDLPWALQNGGSTFEKVRYAYEGSTNVFFVLGDFPQILRTAILEIHPEWEALATPTIEGKPV
jgi:hypothetical protein